MGCSRVLSDWGPKVWKSVAKIVGPLHLDDLVVMIPGNFPDKLRLALRCTVFLVVAWHCLVLELEVVLEFEKGQSVPVDIAHPGP